MNNLEAVENLVGVESEVHIFFQGDVTEELRSKASCMLMAKLRELFGCERASQSATCPNADISCGGFHEFLRNGSRIYLDHQYCEYSTQACKTTAEAVAAIRAGDAMISKAAEELQRTLGKNITVMVVRNNIDHRGHTFGAHVNIRMSRKGFEKIFSSDKVLNGFVIPFLVTLSLICGTGRCSSENDEDIFQIWQRSDFLKEIIGLQTTFDRPLVNTRDESLAADSGKYARLHVVAFDANRMEVAEFLKLGLMRLLCASIDAGRCELLLELDDPIAAIRSVSRTPFDPVRLESNKTISPLEVLRQYLSLFTKLHEEQVFAGRVPDSGEILERCNHVLTKLENDRIKLAGIIDWVTKKILLEQVRHKGFKWSDPEMRVHDICYHRLTDTDVFNHACDKVTTKQQVSSFMTKAPDDSRAALRGTLLRRFGKQIMLVNWHYIINSEGGIAYLLPDNPKPGSTAVADKVKTFEEVAETLELVKLDLNAEEEK